MGCFYERFQAQWRYSQLHLPKRYFLFERDLTLKTMLPLLSMSSERLHPLLVAGSEIFHLSCSVGASRGDSSSSMGSLINNHMGFAFVHGCQFTPVPDSFIRYTIRTDSHYFTYTESKSHCTSWVQQKRQK